MSARGRGRPSAGLYSSSPSYNSPSRQCDATKRHFTRSTPPNSTPIHTPRSSNLSSNATSPIVKKACIGSKTQGGDPKFVKPPPVTASVPTISSTESPLVYKITGLNKKTITPTNPFQALADSIAAVQKDVNKSVLQVKTSVNTGLDHIKKLITEPGTGLVDRISAVEKHVPMIKNLTTTVVNDVEPRLKKVENTLKKVKFTPNDDGSKIATLTGAVGVDSDAFDDLQDRVEILERKAEMAAKKSNILTSWAGTMHRAHDSLKKQVRFNTAKHHANEVLVGGIYEHFNQDNRKAAIKFFREKMKLSVAENDVIQAYHTGEVHTITKGNHSIRCPRQMIVRCTPRLKDLVLQNKKILGGQTDPRDHFTYFVAPNVPEAFKAANAKHKDEVIDTIRENEGKPAEDKKFIRVVGTELSINNEIRPPALSPPTPHEVIHTLETESDRLEDIVFKVTDPVRADGSTFQGFGVRLAYLSTVYLAYVKARIEVPDADHIVAAYNILEGPGSCDDDEHFGDLQMMKLIEQRKMDNVAIFITRKKGPRNIGNKHFQIIRRLTQELLQQLEETREEPMDRGWFSWEEESELPPSEWDESPHAQERHLQNGHDEGAYGGIPTTPVQGIQSLSPDNDQNTNADLLPVNDDPTQTHHKIITDDENAATAETMDF